MGDHPDRDAFGLQDRTLLDVQLEVGVDVAPAHPGVADIADRGERAAVGDAVVVGAGPGPFDVAQTREDGRSEHRRIEAGALLVRPVHHLDGPASLDAVIVEGAKDLEPGEHPEDSVEPAAGVLRVEVTAHEHRRRGVLASLAAREDVAHLVDTHLRARVPAPGDEEVPHLLVRRIEREPAKSLVPPRPDPGRRHHGVPQPNVVDLQEVGAIVQGECSPGCEVRSSARCQSACQRPTRSPRTWASTSIRSSRSRHMPKARKVSGPRGAAPPPSSMPTRLARGLPRKVIVTDSPRSRHDNTSPTRLLSDVALISTRMPPRRITSKCALEMDRRQTTSCPCRVSGQPDDHHPSPPTVGALQATPLPPVTGCHWACTGSGNRTASDSAPP